MRSRTYSIYLWATGSVVGYAALRFGGGGWSDWSILLVVLSICAVVYSVSSGATLSPARLQRITLFCAVLFPAYVAFQLIPLPLFVDRILSPARAEITAALTPVMPASGFAPLSIAPPTTSIYLSRIVAYSIVFLLVTAIASRPTKRLWAPAVPLMTIAGLEAAWGLGQRWRGIEIISGTYLNKNHFSGLLEMVLPFVVLYSFTVRSRGKQGGAFTTLAAIKIAGLLILTGCIFAAIVFSSSKMGFVSTLGSLLAIGVLALWPRLEGWRKWSVYTAMAVLFMAGFFFLPTAQLIGGFGDLAIDRTGEGRWPIWRDTLHLVAAYPAFGCGLGNFYPGFMRYQNAGLNLAWIEPHNDFLQMLSELGISGFLIPAVLLGAAFTLAVRSAVWNQSRNARCLGLACAGGMTAIFIHSFADFNMDVPANAMVLSWIAGMSSALPGRTERRRPERVAPGSRWRRNYLLIAGCLAALYASGWIVFLHFFRHDPLVERRFCHFGICDTDKALTALQVKYGDATPAAVPPSEHLIYLRRDPAGPYRWCDLGESLQHAGRSDQAPYCFTRAIALGPRIPYTLFRAARFRLERGETRDGLELAAHALESDPDYESALSLLYAEHKIPVEDVLRYGLPRDPAPASTALLRRMIAQSRVVDAATAWDWIVAHKFADNKVASEYIGFLLRQGQSEAAAEAWNRYVGKCDGVRGRCNSVFNGDFESELTGSPFDWSIQETHGVSVDFDREIVHSGARSLRIHFDGTQNVASVGVVQRLYLKPGRYHLRAYVRTKDISTDEGVRLEVTSQHSPAHLTVTSKAMLGSNDWEMVQRAFAVAAAGLFEVGLTRTPSWRFDNLISGTVWIDQVSIEPQP